MAMEKMTGTFVFQTDSELVLNVYNRQTNYLISYDETATEKDYCAIYFSSNDIYYPNEEAIFNKQIVEKNFFEWYKCRINRAYKHIFIRDVFKQWYLCGINATINTPEKLLDFLGKETKGYKVYCIGSSAGGYASILYGNLLGAIRIMAFNPQFELNSLLHRSTEEINPILFRLRSIGNDKFFDITRYCEGNIYYFYSLRSTWDVEQHNHLTHHYQGKSVHEMCFNTSHHGIPFLKVALCKVINMDEEQLRVYENKVNNPFFFTVRMVGFRKAIDGLCSQLITKYKNGH